GKRKTPTRRHISPSTMSWLTRCAAGRRRGRASASTCVTFLKKSGRRRRRLTPTMTRRVRGARRVRKASDRLNIPGGGMPFNPHGAKNLTMRMALFSLVASAVFASASRAQAVHQLAATPSTVAYGYYWSEAKPALRVKSGDFVEIETMLTNTPTGLERSEERR